MQLNRALAPSHLACRLAACRPLSLANPTPIGKPLQRLGVRAYTTANGDSITSAEEPPHVTVVGGGAAGLTAAFFAAEHGAKVTVLERTRECGKKILMSGGTRCNVLPFEVDLQQDFFTESSFSAMKAVMASWNLDLCKAWLEDPWWGVGLDLQLEEETGKYFPSSNSSKEVREKLVKACMSRGVVFKYNASVEALQPLQPGAAPATAVAAEAADGTAPQPAAAAATVQRQDAEEEEEEEEARRRERASSGSSAASSCTSASSAGGGGGSGSGGGTQAAQQQQPRRPQWLCRLKDGTTHVTDKVVLATGGLSFPAVGTDGTGHRMLRALGHTMYDTYPALTPLTGTHPAGEQLAGVSMYGIQMSAHLPGQKAPKTSRRTSMLFTHHGYSGPCVLDLSHHAVKALTRGQAAGHTPAAAAGQGQAAGGAGSGAAGGAASVAMAAGQPVLRVNWTSEPAQAWDERLRAGGIALLTTLLQRHGVRERLAQALVKEVGLAGKRVADINKVQRAALVGALTAYPLHYHGHEGYKKAEVTGGGVKLSEIDCATMESRLLPGLYLCGEVLDVFGRIGGFNFYWAWVSGRLAGVGAAQGGLRPSRAAAKGRKAPAAAAKAA